MPDAAGTRDIFARHQTAGAPRPEIRYRLAVIVGIGSYPRQPLKNAPHDAKAVAELLKCDYGFRVTILDEEKATREAIKQAILGDLATADDEAQWVFYFAGHGGKKGSQGYLIPVNGDPADPGTCLAVDWLQECCIGSRCAEILIILDTCKAGQALVQAEDLDGPMSPDPEKRRRVRQILCSANPDQAALDGWGEEEHSAFTLPLLEALIGRTEVHDGDGSVRFGPLRDFVIGEVERRLTEAQVTEDRRQKPIGGHFAGNDEQRDFVFRTIVPRVSPGIVQALRSEEAPRRLEGLRLLVRHCYTEPGRLPSAVALAKECTRPCLTRDERVRAAKVLCQLARIGGAEPEWPSSQREVDSRLGEIFCKLAVEDHSPAVRDWARRGLRRTGKGTRVKAADRLFERYRISSDSAQRRRAWAGCVVLPEARRLLPWTNWWRLPLSRSRLWIASLGWALVETKARRRVLTWTSAPVGLLYAVLGCSYYFSASNQSVVIRAGHPGFKILPGVGQTLVVTGYGVRDLKDPSLAQEERLMGFWPLLRDGALPWGEQLFEQLDPAEGGLAEWRMGQEKRAFVRFQEGIEAGDEEAVPLLGYVALQSASAVRLAVDLLVLALAGEEKLHDPALAALAIVRDTQPATAEAALAELARRLRSASGAEAVALVESIEVLDPQQPGESPVPAALLELLRVHPRDSALRLRIARALKGLVGRDPARLVAILPEISTAIRQGPAAERGAWLSILENPVALPPEVERPILDTLIALLSREADPVKQDTLIDSLGRRLARSPGMATAYSPAVSKRLADRDPQVRLAAARALAALPTGSVPAAAVVETLADLARRGEGTRLRTEAVEILGTFRHPGSRESVISALIAASADGDGDIRTAAVDGLVDQGLTSSASARRILPVLQSLLGDGNPWVRWDAAQGVLLFEEETEDASVAFDELMQVISTWNSIEAEITYRSLAERFTKPSLEIQRRLVRRLALFSRDLDSPAAARIFELLQSLEKRQPLLLPGLALAMAELVGTPDASGDVRERAQYCLWELRTHSASGVAAALAEILEHLRRSSMVDRGAVVESLGYLTAGHEAVALTATRRLGSLMNDPEPGVRAGAATALGVIGANQHRAVRDLAPALLAGLTSEASSVRAASARALGRIHVEKALSARVTPLLLAALRDGNPAIRRDAAAALANWGSEASQEMRIAISPLRDRLARENDPEVRSKIVSALAVIGGGDPAVAAQVMASAKVWLTARDRDRRAAGAWLMRDLAENHPRPAGQAISILGSLLHDSDDMVRRTALLALFYIGAADVENGARALDTVGPLLLDPEWPSRWDAIANHIRPLFRRQPVLAPRAVRWLRKLLASETLESGYSYPTLGPLATDALIEALTLHAHSNSDAPWLLLISSNGFEREVGGEVLVRIAANQPEQIPTILDRLARCRRHLNPHVRLSIAETTETIFLLRKTREMAGTPGVRRWREVLEGLPPRVGMLEAVRLALDKLETEVQHG